MKKIENKAVLAFNKSNLVELNDAQLHGTESGVTPYVLFVGAIALGIAIGGAFDDWHLLR